MSTVCHGHRNGRINKEDVHGSNTDRTPAAPTGRSLTAPRHPTGFCGESIRRAPSHLPLTTFLNERERQTGGHRHLCRGSHVVSIRSPRKRVSPSALYRLNISR